MTSFFDKVLIFAHMPVVRDNVANKVAYVAEIVILLAVVFLIIDILIKLKNKEQFFTCGTSFLIVILLMSLVIFWVFTKIPVTVDIIWPILRPITDIGN